MDILRERTVFCLVLAVSAITTTSGPTCTDLLHKPVKDVRQDVFIYRKFSLIGRSKCWKMCVTSASCLSVNFNLQSYDCEINRKAKPIEKLVYSPGWEYINKTSLLQMFDDNCAANPCPAFTTCSALRSGVAICVKSECGEAPEVPFTEPRGAVIFRVGKTVTYECVENYTLGFGDGQLTCLANGQFENVNFGCVPI